MEACCGGNNNILVYMVFGDYVIMCMFVYCFVAEYVECDGYVRGDADDGRMWVMIFDWMHKSWCDSMAWHMRLLGTRAILQKKNRMTKTCKFGVT